MAQARYCPQLPLLTLALLATGHAAAQQSPYYIGGSLSVTHVSNIYHTTEGEPTNNDTVTTTSLLAGLDQHLGRQRLFGDLALRNNHYQNDNSLSNNGYTLNAGLDWETVNRLSGQLSINSNQALAAFNSGDAPSVTEKNIERSNQARAVVRYGLASLLTLEGSLTYRRRDYSLIDYDAYEYSQNALSLGLVYRPSAALSLGVAGRYTDGEYPRYSQVDGVYQANTFKRRDIDLTSTWVASGASTLITRLSFGKRDSELASARDFSGVTGSLNWRWQPSAKLNINTILMRDTGDETSFSELDSSGSVTSDYSRITTSLRINTGYALTGKVTLDAGVSVADRDLSNTSSGVTTDDNDTTTSLSLGVRWAVTRNGTLGCQLTYEKRTGGGTLSDPYSADSYGCFGRLILR